MLPTAVLEIRLFPWTLRRRQMSAGAFRSHLNDAAWLDLDDLGGMLVGLLVWLGLYVAAPIVVVVLAALLFSVELPLLLLLAAVLLVGRFTGLIPWTVVVFDPATQSENREHFRLLPRALARVRDASHDGRVRARWTWF